ENSFGDVDSVMVEIEGDVVALFDDPFSPPNAGPGPNWQPAATGFPNVVCDRITLDATHLGLRMATADTNPPFPIYGIQLVSPLQIPKDATRLDIDFLVQPRNGGAFDTRLVMQDLGDNDSLTLSFNEFYPGGGTRRLVTLGSGGGGAFSQSSGDYAFGPGTLYHALASISPAGTTVTFKSEDLNTVIQTFTVPQLTLSNLLGSAVQLSILQQDTAHTADYIGSPECFVDRLTVKVTSAAPPPLIINVAKGGNIINDSKPVGVLHDGVNYAAAWAASNTDSNAVTRSDLMQFSAAATNQIVLGADPDFNSASGTIMFWMRSSGTTGSGNAGAILFDRTPTDSNGPPGAIIVQTDAGHVLAQAVAGTGIAGFPNEVSQRINLNDPAQHFGYRMRTSDLSGAVYGIQLATPLAIATGETSLNLDLLVQNRSGGAYPARLVLSGFGGSKSLTITLNEFPPDGHVRQFTAFGTGGGGAFSQASSDYAQSSYNFYHVLIVVDATGTKIDLWDEAMSTDLQTFVVPELTIADMAGSSLQLSILQAANNSSATESLVDNLNVTSAVGGLLLDDPFEPPGDGPGLNWVAAIANGVVNQIQSAHAIADSRWHQIALTYDQSASGSSALFIDGVQDSSQTNAAAWSWTARQEIELGRSHNTYWRAYDGLLDDFRIYNRKLTASEITQAANTGALVDNAALMVRFNFDGPPSGWTLTWPGAGTLQSTTNVMTPVNWNPVPNSHSPYYIRPNDAPMLFYRVVGQ
ncbi:MAG: LamG domain-containing protein, partial [Verrucomicrobia bacterium]|nr:LamG domain-containing protein [Verrucomicrobiota bacterium]